MSDERNRDRKYRVELGYLFGHAKTAKWPRVYFRTCFDTKAKQSLAQVVSSYLMVRGPFLSLSEESPN